MMKMMMLQIKNELVLIILGRCLLYSSSFNPALLLLSATYDLYIISLWWTGERMM